MNRNPNVPQEVIAALESARQNGDHVRVFYGDTDTPDFEKIHGRKCDPGKDWGEEYETFGTSYACWMTCDHIVRILVKGREVYRHPNYHQPAYSIGQPPEMIGNSNVAADGYTTGVYADGENVANFKKESSALRWVAFMTGKRMSK